ncbi:MAG: amidohydrolase family protein, partial [Firmicutes bacterium]|nr:amidohydrolase family protein [Bacillota bacterium]
GTTTAGCYVGLGESIHKGSYDEIFDSWKETWEKNAAIDCFFHGGIMSQTNIDDIEKNASKYGISSYKILMTCKGEESKMIGGDPADDGFLWSAFQNIARLKKPGYICLHAENIEIISRILPTIRATGRQDLAAWAEARPGWCETLDVKRAIALAKTTGCPLYFVHIHHGDSVKVIEQAQAEGLNVVAETCPQYLLLNTNSDVPASQARIAPPIRNEASNEAIWKALKDGIITCIGSDHCSVAKDSCKDLWTAPQGAPGTESLLPVLLSEGVHKGRITLQKLVEILCYNNAKTFGIYPQKGTIQVGSDADLVIVDPDKKVTISNDNLHYKISDYSCFNGYEVTGWPLMTMVRGKVVVENGEMIAEPGWGRYIPR